MTIIHIIGIITIILGFFIPYLTEGIIPSIIFFWFGFLLLLKPNKYLDKDSVWLKWARLGLAIHVFGNLFLKLYFHLYFDTSIGKILPFFILKSATWLFNFVDKFIELILPYPQILSPEGNVGIVISFLRMTVQSFISVIFYMLIGVIIGKLILKKTELIN